MFLSKSLSYLTTRAPGRSIPKMRTYLEYMEDQAWAVYKNYREPDGMLTQTVMMLDKLLWDCDPMAIARTLDAPDADPFYVFDNIVMPIVHTAKTEFDPVLSSHNTTDLVNSRGCKEFLFPVDNSNPIENLPIDQKWEEWNSVQVLHMVDVDSEELSLLFYANAITFKLDHPVYAIFTLDVAALVMKFVAYLREYHKTEDGIPIDDLQGLSIKFIHRHVISQCFLRDELRLWFLKNYTNVLDVSLGRADGITALQPGRDTPWLSATNARVGSQYSAVFNDFLKLCGDVKTGSLSAPRLLNSMVLPFGGTVQSQFLRLQTVSEFPNLRQYRWGEFMQNLPYLKIFIQVLTLYTDNPQVESTLRYLKRDMQVLFMSHPWRDIRVAGISELIEDRMITFRDSIDSLVNEL